LLPIKNKEGNVILPPGVVEEIFSNIESILKVNEVFLTALKENVNLDLNVGSIMVQLVTHSPSFFSYFLQGPVFKPYYMSFTESYPHSVARLKEYKEKLPSFSNLLIVSDFFFFFMFMFFL
jgi:hypothetical protein